MWAVACVAPGRALCCLCKSAHLGGAVSPSQGLQGPQMPEHQQRENIVKLICSVMHGCHIDSYCTEPREAELERLPLGAELHLQLGTGSEGVLSGLHYGPSPGRAVGSVPPVPTAWSPGEGVLRGHVFCGACRTGTHKSKSHRSCSM